MRSDDKMFDESDAIEYYDEDGFNDIPRNQLMDFLPRIYHSELADMDVWENHLKSVGTPYAITKHKTQYSDRSTTHFALWKQRRV